MRKPLDDAAREAVTSACKEVRTGGEGDLVDRVVPTLVARPTSTQQVSEVLRAAAAHRLTVVSRGRGTKTTWGMPPSSADVLVDLAAMDQVLDHQAGDLIVETQAGARLAEPPGGGGEGGGAALVRGGGSRRSSARRGSGSCSTRRCPARVSAARLPPTPPVPSGCWWGRPATCSSGSRWSGRTAWWPRPAAAWSRTSPATTSAS